MIGPIAEVAGKVAEVAVETSKETAKEVGKSVAKKSVDVSKRVEIGGTYKDGLKSSVDITKRISPEKGVNIPDTAKELTVKQKNNLIDKGMSKGIISDCKHKDGIFSLKTTNEKFVDIVQPETGVKYVRKIVDVFGNKIEGVFPKFKSEFTVKLTDNLLQASDKKQFDYCVSELQKAISNDPELKNKFSKRQLDQIAHGKTPSGYVWHHNEEVGKMELVDFKTHDAAKHTGGRAIWGGGTSHR